MKKRNEERRGGKAKEKLKEKEKCYYLDMEIIRNVNIRIGTDEIHRKKRRKRRKNAF